MASSVSSERAFLAVGITISKCQNCLCVDIVEALQFLKCAIRSDLLFHDVPTSFNKKELDDICDDDRDPAWQDVDC